jgi:hypothetical protein
MSEIDPDGAALDRAYSDGRLVGFFGLATSAGCPFVGERSDQTDLRIAWLDGFAFGQWEGSTNTPAPDQRTSHDSYEISTICEDEPYPLDNGDRAIADIAIAHLLRLSKHGRSTTSQGCEIGSTLEAADCFSVLLRLTRPDRSAAADAA